VSNEGYSSIFALNVSNEGYSSIFALNVSNEGYSSIFALNVSNEGYSSKAFVLTQFDIYIFIILHFFENNTNLHLFYSVLLCDTGTTILICIIM
jgi:hypothetical protein